MSDDSFPDDWLMHSDRPQDSEEYNPQRQPLVNAEHESEAVQVTVERPDPTEGRSSDIIEYELQIKSNMSSSEEGPDEYPANTIEKQRREYVAAREEAHVFARSFSEALAAGESVDDAFDHAVEQIKD